MKDLVVCPVVCHGSFRFVNCFHHSISESPPLVIIIIISSIQAQPKTHNPLRIQDCGYELSVPFNSITVVTNKVYGPLVNKKGDGMFSKVDGIEKIKERKKLPQLFKVKTKVKYL